MDGTRVVLIRHGESCAQEREFMGGHSGCTGLSELGRRQAKALAERLAASGELADASALYASLMPRAVETASIIADAIGGHEIVQDCDLCEFHPGEGDGLTYAEYDRRWPSTEPWHPDLRRAPGSETWSEMAARVARGLDRIVERHRGETVVVACHGGVIVHSLNRWLGLASGGIGERAWFNPVNTSLTEWRYGPTPSWHPASISLELVRFNDHAHLVGLS
jgi:broad specificity phosphatase PhoE